ncbi:hypothetical protein BDY21DRAFT_376504 [Lineolata rhizophorae]|uniref:Uncharacterized protein n=1 Tax=Lineolata rhizophorae TaxID=578093 RepID=A0A6A6PCF4_9PEZI|nr:hypothetical protein BDY21DRAFT_376504 [Lineolata rhizophorae]
MEVSSPPSFYSTRSSRRSFPNLHHLSLAPLSSRFPIDDAADDDGSGSQHSGSGGGDPSFPRSSYIANASAPTTPSILGRSPSRRRLHSNKGVSSKHGGHRAMYYYSGHAPGLRPDAADLAPGDITKAKSSSALLGGSSALGPLPHGARTGTLTPAGSSAKRRSAGYLGPSAGGRDTGADEWLHRAGLAIAAEARESKGQAWLVSRASSTSLVRSSEDNDDSDSAEADGLDDEGAAGRRGGRLGSDDDRFRLRLRRASLASSDPFDDTADELGAAAPAAHAAAGRTPRRSGSRLASAPASRWASRHGSRVGGSRPDLHGAGGWRTPRTGGALGEETGGGGYFGDDVVLAAEPDFVEGDPDEDEAAIEDEAEVARLAGESGAFGLGGWVDRLIGWSLFSVDEDAEGSDVEEGEGTAAGAAAAAATTVSQAEEEGKKRRGEEAARRREDLERITASIVTGEHHGEPAVEVQEPAQEEGGWHDAAWLLSVASKVIL